MTKRIFIFALSAMLLFLLAACEESAKKAEPINSDSPFLQLKTSEVIDYEYRLENGKLFYYKSHPEIMLSDEDAEKYPELAKTLSELVAGYTQEPYPVDEEYEEFAKEVIANSPDMQLYDTTEVRVRRADDKVLSLQFLYDGYSGGAHGYYFFGGRTFETKTGRELSYSDIVTDKDAFFDAILKEIAEIREELYLIAEEDLSAMLGEENVFSWTLENDSITVSFPPYAIGSFAAGTPTVVISESEYPGIIKEEYISKFDFFATEFLWDTLAYDVTGDGVPDKISASFWSGYDTETGNGHISVSVNDNECTKEFLFDEGGDAVFIKTPEGKCFVYIYVPYVDASKQSVLCYELGESPKEVSGAEGLSFYYESGENPMKWVITNPESFYLEDNEGKVSEFRVGEKDFLKK